MEMCLTPLYSTSCRHNVRQLGTLSKCLKVGRMFESLKGDNCGSVAEITPWICHTVSFSHWEESNQVFLSHSGSRWVHMTDSRQWDVGSSHVPHLWVWPYDIACNLTHALVLSPSDGWKQRTPKIRKGWRRRGRRWIPSSSLLEESHI